jgi:hypothetical protein
MTGLNSKLLDSYMVIVYFLLVGICDIELKQKIPFLNEMKRYEIEGKLKCWVQKIIWTWS